MDQKMVSIKIKLSLSKNDLPNFKPETTKINIKNVKLDYLKDEKTDPNVFVFELHNIQTGVNYKNLFVTANGLNKKIKVDDIFVSGDLQTKQSKNNIQGYLRKTVKNNHDKI